MNHYQKRNNNPYTVRNKVYKYFLHYCILYPQWSCSAIFCKHYKIQYGLPESHHWYGERHQPCVLALLIMLKKINIMFAYIPLVWCNKIKNYTAFHRKILTFSFIIFICKRCVMEANAFFLWFFFYLNHLWISWAFIMSCSYIYLHLYWCVLYIIFRICDMIANDTPNCNVFSSLNFGNVL